MGSVIFSLCQSIRSYVLGFLRSTGLTPAGDFRQILAALVALGSRYSDVSGPPRSYSFSVPSQRLQLLASRRHVTMSAPGSRSSKINSTLALLISFYSMRRTGAASASPKSYSPAELQSVRVTGLETRPLRGPPGMARHNSSGSCLIREPW